VIGVRIRTGGAPRSNERVRPWYDRFIPVLSVAGALATWELLSRLDVLDGRYIPSMSTTLGRLSEVVTTGEFWQAVNNTLQGWAIGLAIAIVLAVPLGIVIGSSRLIYRSLQGIIEFLRPVPAVALIPVAILLYGTGLKAKVFLAAFASFWPLFIQTLYGVQDVDPVATDTARAFGLNRIERLYKVTLRSAVPYIATGIRVSSAIALILTIVAEIVLGSPGLGREISRASGVARFDTMYAYVITIGVVGWLLNSLAMWANKRVLHWHPSYREAL
jgi:ABC-type nitrate/sulfonate/bicarbonate transport system permease component